MPKEQNFDASGCLINDQPGGKAVSPDSSADDILRRGGLREMKNMSVFLTRDELIILADPTTGMAALVTGVAKVGDAELATIAGAGHAAIHCALVALACAWPVPRPPCK
jgi:hypothetical protein